MYKKMHEEATPTPPLAQRMPRKWTTQEDEVLRQEVLAQSDGDPKDWCQIASKLAGRTNKDCRKRWHNAVAGGLKKGQWAKAEDEALARGVKAYGQRWTMVAEMVESRSADQCAKRWQQSLDPELDRSEWTEEENWMLVHAVNAVGRQWKVIQRMHFPGRSRNCIKNRYTVMMRKVQNQTRDNENRRRRRRRRRNSDVKASNARSNSGGSASSSDDEDGMLVNYSLHEHDSGVDSEPRTYAPSTRDSLVCADQDLLMVHDRAIPPTGYPGGIPTSGYDTSGFAHSGTAQLWPWNADMALAPAGSDFLMDSFDYRPNPAFDSAIDDEMSLTDLMNGVATDTSASAVTVSLTVNNPNTAMMQDLLKIAIENEAQLRVGRE